MSEGLLDVRVKYDGAVPGGLSLSQREFNELKRRAWEEIGRFWHSELRPKHFTHEGAREYGYLPRRGETGNQGKGSFWRSYTGRKQKEKHHTLPLVFGGELRTLSKIARIEATSTSTRSRLRIILPAAGKANLKNPNSRIDMREELTRVSPAEAEEIVRRFDAIFERLLAEHQATRTQETN